MGKLKLNIIINIALILSINNILSSSNELECTIKNKEEAEKFLSQNIGDKYLDTVINYDAAKIAINSMAESINFKAKESDIDENAKKYLELIKKGQTYVNYIIENKINKIPGYDWKDKYNEWLNSDYEILGEHNWLDDLIKDLIDKRKQTTKSNKTSIEKFERLEKLEKIRKEFLESIISLQSYLFALSQTHSDKYKGFQEGIFSILKPYKDDFKKIQQNYLNLVLEILKTKFPTENEKDLISHTYLASIRKYPNEYSYYVTDSHGFDKDSTEINLKGINYKFNKEDQGDYLDWMYKFRRILMGSSKDQFWWKPEVLEKYKDSIIKAISKMAGLQNKSESATENNVKKIIDLFENATDNRFKDIKKIKDIYSKSLYLNKINENEELTNLISMLKRNYTHLDKRWGNEIILDKEDFITSYLNNPKVNDTIKRYIHYFINVKRLLNQFQKHLKTNEPIKIISPLKQKFIVAPKSYFNQLTIIGHRIESQAKDPIIFVKNELNNLKCLTKTLDNELKESLNSTANNDMYNYLQKLQNKINDILENKEANKTIQNENIFEIN